MKKLYFSFTFLLFTIAGLAQDTFSIVAVDSATGEVGSAGCTCLEAPFPPEGCLIISDLIPGKGAIHTQALWNEYNQDAAHDYMASGYSPQDILENILRDDENGDSTIRQYGIALFDTARRVRTAAFTGANCMDYKGHIVGPYYAIQGNIIIGQETLDSMEANFLNTPGSLATRLMAALQGANVPGADTRCLNEGVPGKSAFIRVAKPGDNINNLYLHELVVSRPYGMSPIDSLQTLFNAWKVLNPDPAGIADVKEVQMKLFPNPATSVCNVQFSDNSRKLIKVMDVLGNVIYQEYGFSGLQISTAAYAKGAYFVQAGASVHKLIVQ